MSSTAIWGVPSICPAESNEWSWYREDEDRTYRELRGFLQREIDHWDPDFVVVYERKGTAIFRCLIESKRNPLRWPWNKVVSSSALKELPAEVLRNSRLLVFDDMVRTGKHLKRVARLLLDNGADSALQNVRFVAFAAHEDASCQNISGRSLDAWFYRALTSQSYAQVRERIVRLLQTEGSLMLDTEHLEVRITLKHGFNRLMNALRRKATPIEFRSGGDRTNITIYYGDNPSHCLPEDWFPIGTGFSDIVKKSRMVQRDDPDEFAIIPICLPAVPIGGPWPDRTEDVKILGNIISRETPNPARFYAAALLGSLQSLEWILKDLYVADPGGFGIRYPCYSNDFTGKNSYSLNHLRVMYPTLNVDALVERIIRVGKEAERFGHKCAQKQARVDSPKAVISNAELHEKAMQLLQVIRYTLDQRRAEMSVQDIDPLVPNPGLRAKEVFDLAKRLDWGSRNQQEWLPAAISTLFDILIDDAKLVTRVEYFPDEAGRLRWTRTFKPDGEVVSELVRDYNAQWGLPRGF